MQPCWRWQALQARTITIATGPCDSIDGVAICINNIGWHALNHKAVRVWVAVAAVTAILLFWVVSSYAAQGWRDKEWQALIQAVSAAVQAVSAAFTLLATFYIAKATINQARITAGQLAVMQKQADIEFATQRAILNVRHMRAYEVKEFNKSAAYIAFVPEIENVGVRPTFDCVASTHFLVSPTAIIDVDFDFLPIVNSAPPTEGKPAYHGPFPRYFGPKAVTDGPRAIIRLADVQGAHEDVAYIYVWGWLDYDDGFKNTERRRTEFAFELIAVGDPKEINAHTFRFNMLGRHNGADEGCYRYPASYADGLAGHLGQLRPVRYAAG